MDSAMPLVPLSVLLGNPVFSNVQVSPDGRYVSFLKPSPDKDVLNVWVRELPPGGGGDERGGGESGADERGANEGGGGGTPAAPAGAGTGERRQGEQGEQRQGEQRAHHRDVMVTSDGHRGIRTYTWAEDSRHILYLQDTGGDEDWHLFCQPLEPGRPAKHLTPFKGVRCENLLTDPGHPHTVLVGLNRRDRAVFDMHRVDLLSGDVELDTQNPGDVLSWFADDGFAVRGALAMNPEDGSKTLRVRAAAEEGSPWFDLAVWPPEEEGRVVCFSKDGSSVYVASSIGRDTTELQLLDARGPPPGAAAAASGDSPAAAPGPGGGATVLERLAASPRCDVDRVLVDRAARRPQAASFNYLRREWEVLDPSLSDDFAALLRAAGEAEADLLVESRSLDGAVWVVSLVRDDAPAAFYVYRRTPAPQGCGGGAAGGRLHKLFVDRPDLAAYRLARRHPVLLTARDGVRLPSYLSLPPLPGCPERLLGPEPAEDPSWGQLEGLRLPAVLLVHGGPWHRDEWGLDVSAQWLANRGYAVLQVNYRASTGFGKTFLHLGDRQWGVGTMQHDLTDAVEWAASVGVADRRRVAIMGGSYGGYATLAGLCFTPELYCCGVDVVGPSHIRTLLATVPAYWRPMRRMLLQRVGDAEADDELNRRISPLHHVDAIRAPLVIAQGQNDPRVKRAESDQIFRAMRQKGLQVEYYAYTDEGHGFARPPNRLDFYSRADQFLSRHLGGRAEPQLHPKGSSVVCVHLLDSMDDGFEGGTGGGRGEDGEEEEEEEAAAPGRRRLSAGQRAGLALGVPAAVLAGGAALVVAVLRGLSPRR